MRPIHELLKMLLDIMIEDDTIPGLCCGIMFLSDVVSFEEKEEVKDYIFRHRPRTWHKISTKLWNREYPAYWWRGTRQPPRLRYLKRHIFINKLIYKFRSNESK